MVDTDFECGRYMYGSDYSSSVWWHWRKGAHLILPLRLLVRVPLLWWQPCHHCPDVTLLPSLVHTPWVPQWPTLHFSPEGIETKKHNVVLDVLRHPSTAPFPSTCSPLLTCQTPTTAFAIRMRRITKGSTNAVAWFSLSSNHAKIWKRKWCRSLPVL